MDEQWAMDLFFKASQMAHVARQVIGSQRGARAELRMRALLKALDIVRRVCPPSDCGEDERRELEAAWARIEEGLIEIVMDL